MLRRISSLAVVFVLAAACGVSDPSASGGESESVGIGDPASDGKFTFTVHDVECGAKAIGTNQFLKAKASGNYCVVDLTVKNTGDEAQSMFADNQYLFIGDKEYAADFDSTMASKPGRKLLFKELNPDISIDGLLVFDVPKGATPDRLELHDSAFSGGVNVGL